MESASAGSSHSRLRKTTRSADRAKKKTSDNLPNDKARRERDDEPMIEIYISAKTFDDTSSTGSEFTGLGQLLLLVIAMLRYCGKKHVLRCCAHRGSFAVRNCVTADIGLLSNQSQGAGAEVSLSVANLVVTRHCVCELHCRS